MKSSCYVAKITPDLFDQLQRDLKEKGFTFSQPQHTQFQAKREGIVLTLYLSGKLTVQGRAKDEFIEFYLEPEILKTFAAASHDFTPRIGIDEAGKGDVFGPLCVGGVFANESQIQRLIAIGVKDSKSMNDTVIVRLAREIKALCPCSIVRMYPDKYNQLYARFKNLNHLLAWGHATAIEELVQKAQCSNVIIDQFASESVVLEAVRKKSLSINLTQRHKGESDIVVAAASIIARAAFVEGIDQLSNRANVKLPKGANHGVIQAGRSLIAFHGQEALPSYAKMHFKTVQEILNA